MLDTETGRNLKKNLLSFEPNPTSLVERIEANARAYFSCGTKIPNLFATTSSKSKPWKHLRRRSPSELLNDFAEQVSVG